jgi:hypothetical protein
MEVSLHHSRSPYLKQGRLADLMAAIQMMAIHERYRRSSADWAELISGDSAKSSYWESIFADHPEFFRQSAAHQGDYALVWRRAGNSRYHRGIGKILQSTEVDNLSQEERRYLSRPPVPEGQIKTLLDTAINLHQRAVEEYRDRRWWVGPVTTIVNAAGSFVGALIGGHVK